MKMHTSSAAVGVFYFCSSFELLLNYCILFEMNLVDFFFIFLL